MPKKNIIYIFYPKGTPAEVVRIIDAAVRDTRRELIEEQRGRSFTKADHLKAIKTKLSTKLAGLPARFRITILERIERDIPPDHAARTLALWNEATEEYRHIEIPDFESVTDPTITPSSSSKTEMAAGIALAVLALTPIIWRIYNWLKR